MSHLLSKVIYICLSQSKYWNVKSRSMSQSKVKENARTFSIQGLTLSTITAAENSL